MITITLDKPSYAAGETVRAGVEVQMKKPTKARGLFAELVCNERKQVKTQHVMDTYDYNRMNEMGTPRSTHIDTHVSEQAIELFRQEKKVAEEGVYSAEKYEIAFILPKNAPPTSREFGHDGKIHKWKLHVKLDIPLALDESAETEVFVGGL